MSNLWRVLLPIVLAICAGAVPWSGHATSTSRGETAQQVSVEHSRELSEFPEEHTDFLLADLVSGLELARPRGRRLGRRLGDSIEGSSGHLRLHFKAHGESFDVELHRRGGPIAAGAEVQIWKDGQWYIEPIEQSLIFVNHEKQAVFSHFNGELSGALVHRGKLYDLASSAGGQKLRVRDVSAAGRGLHRAAQLRLQNHSLDIPAQAEERHAQERRLIFATERIEKFIGCWPGENGATREIQIGLGMGSKMYTIFQNDKLKAMRYLEDLVIKTNMIYKAQLNVVLTIKRMVIVESNWWAPSWNNHFCFKSINKQLEDLSRWEPPDQQAIWHVVDDCFGTSGTIGLAYVGTMCNNMWIPANNGFVNTGVTWASQSTWLTFAHEVGHNFGAGHSFELGQGQTGGIMDYGDGRLNGTFQFNSEFRKAEICNAFSQTLHCNYSAEVSARCGDGFVEGEEECECVGGGTSCRHCECCVLTGGAECTPDGIVTVDRQCCEDTGKFKTPSAACDGLDSSKGYCIRGVCEVDNVCAQFSAQLGDYCGVSARSECRYVCSGPVSCGLWDPIKFTSGKVANNLPDGTPCGFQGTGACSQGECNELGVWVEEAEAPLVRSIAEPGTASTTFAECIGYGHSAFLGIPDVLLPESMEPYTLFRCHDACRDSPTCRSFSFNSDNQRCELWTPVKMDEDLVNISGYDSFICDQWAVGQYFVDADKWESRVVASAGLPDLSCANCAANSCSEDCTPFTVSQCEQACKSKPPCNMMIYGTMRNRSGTCELWSTKHLKDLVSPMLGDAADAYWFPCQGGNICNCRQSSFSKVRINCQCNPGAGSNECAAGKYCYNSQCHDMPASRRLRAQECSGVDVFEGTTTYFPGFWVGKAAGHWSIAPLAIMLAGAAAALAAL